MRCLASVAVTQRDCNAGQTSRRNQVGRLPRCSVLCRLALVLALVLAVSACLPSPVRLFFFSLAPLPVLFSAGSLSSLFSCDLVHGPARAIRLASPSRSHHGPVRKCHHPPPALFSRQRSRFCPPSATVPPPARPAPVSLSRTASPGLMESIRIRSTLLPFILPKSAPTAPGTTLPSPPTPLPKPLL